MKKRLLKNAFSSVVQFAVNSAVLFVFYKFLLVTIGALDIGVWSLVLGVSSLTQMAAFGFSGGAVKYVAAYLAKGDQKRVSAVIQTSLLSVAALVSVFLMVCAPAIKPFLIKAVGHASAYKVDMIFPYGVICLWLMVIVNVIFSSLDGYQKMYLRNYLSMGGAVLNLILCFLVVPRFGLLGLAILGLVQNGLFLFLGWMLLRRLNRLLPLIPCVWDRGVFREVIGYNVKFQLISFTVVFCEPVTKYFLSVFGGVAMVGYYEMASRLAAQVRGVIVAANQAIVPTIASYAETESAKVRSIYINSFQLLLYSALPVYCLLIIAAPLICKVWIGNWNGVFVLALTALFFAHFVNILSSPAYFSNLGSGQLQDNLIGHVGLALANLAMAFLLGSTYGAKGVILAWAIAFIFSSLFILISFNRRNMISLKVLFSSGFASFTYLIIAGFICGELMYWALQLFVGAFNAGMIITTFYLFVISFFLFQHPFRKKIASWLSREGAV